MAYAVYSFASQYTDTGQIGVYIGTREENLRECLEIIARADRRHRRRQPAARRAGAREGEHEGPDHALDGIDLEPDEPAREVADLDTELLSLERIIAEIEAVEPEELAELAGVLLAPEKLSAAGIGPSEKRFLAAVERVNPELARAA